MHLWPTNRKSKCLSLRRRRAFDSAKYHQRDCGENRTSRGRFTSIEVVHENKSRETKQASGRFFPCFLEWTPPAFVPVAWKQMPPVKSAKHAPVVNTFLEGLPDLLTAPDGDLLPVVNTLDFHIQALPGILPRYATDVTCPISFKNWTTCLP